jgi:hypothetical protein
MGKWTKEDLRVLRKEYKNPSNAFLEGLLGGRHTDSAIRKKASVLGLRKSRKYLLESGLRTRGKKRAG